MLLASASQGLLLHHNLLRERCMLPKKVMHTGERSQCELQQFGHIACPGSLPWGCKHASVSQQVVASQSVPDCPEAFFFACLNMKQYADRV